MINMIRDFFFNINYINIQIRYPLVALLWVSECQRSNLLDQLFLHQKTNWKNKNHLFRNNDKMKTSYNQNKLLFYSDFSTLTF